ncbi:MAG: vWA domain-containing protein [Pyrinomonadaceae bacterium]
MATLDSVDLITNQQPRCACALILDTSESMKGARIDALNAGLRTLRKDLLDHQLAQKRVEIAVVEFNSSARVVQDFATAADFQPPSLTASGVTEMADGINRALDLIQQRKAKYRSHGVPFYRPWAFLITDGQPTSSSNDMDAVTRRIHDDELNKRVIFFSVGVQGADFTCLERLSTQKPKMLDGLKFEELFLWLSNSLDRVSQAKMGEMASLPKGNWESVPV